MSEFPAHIRFEADGSETVQSVAEHCRTTADYAALALRCVGLAESAYLAGLIHDVGKLTDTYADYITRATHGLPARRGEVNHTFAGVRLILEYRRSAEEADVACELLALAVGSHHGWFDCVDEQRRSGFARRMTQTNIGCEEALQSFMSNICDNEEFNRRFWDSTAELDEVLRRICDKLIDEKATDDCYEKEAAFYAGMLARLLLSAVIEGDRRDTAEFMNGTVYPKETESGALRQLWAQCLQRTEQRLDSFLQGTDIAAARREVSERCRAAAGLSEGIYRLNVPTGSGKTLSSLRYALAHAAKYGKQRIIFTSPLLSILEQNAAAIRDCIGDDSLILEHHSNLVQTTDDLDKLDINELRTETWNAPIILTTLVQLLNTMFCGKTSAIRRFHSLCHSVIVIDEVQTVPSRMLSMFTLAVNFLSEICGATVILCSATQPCTERIEHPLHVAGDLIPFDEKLWAVFRRTEIKKAGSRSLAEIAAMASDVLGSADSLLIVCNKKAEATELYRLTAALDARVFILSAAMCVAHRRETLAELRVSLLTPGVKTLCISTQVIEAGVDISFQRVIRFTAGMDSVIQAAGRCNRNRETGDGGISPVYVVQCSEESLGRLPDIQAGKDATIELLTEFDKHPERYNGSLDSDEAIRGYYTSLYRRMPRGHRDYSIAGKPYTLFSLLSRNEFFDCEDSETFYFRQAFRLAGSLFEVFAEDTTDVIVSYGEGAELIADLRSDRAKHDTVYVQERLKRAKAYSVALYRYQFDALRNEGVLRLLSCGVWALDGHYDARTGFDMKDGTLDFKEV